jgi:glycosyltransferase involved in cell wall biosynthesis
LQLADAVEEFLRDENLRARLGANAQATAREKFGLERMIDEIEKIYAGL